MGDQLSPEVKSYHDGGRPAGVGMQERSVAPSCRAEGKNGDSAITLDANGIADHDDREAAVAEQAFGNPLDIVERNRID